MKNNFPQCEKILGVCKPKSPLVFPARVGLSSNLLGNDIRDNTVYLYSPVHIYSNYGIVYPCSDDVSIMYI